MDDIVIIMLSVRGDIIHRWIFKMGGGGGKFGGVPMMRLKRGRGYACLE